jgi:hypothetical protein
MPCPAGSYSVTTGATSCSSGCPAGYLCDGTKAQQCTYGTTLAGCGAYTYTAQGAGTSITGPSTIKGGTSFIVTGTAPGYVGYAPPPNVRWHVDGTQQFNTCTDPLTCTFTLPAGHAGVGGAIIVQMKSDLYNLPEIRIPLTSIPATLCPANQYSVNGTGSCMNCPAGQRSSAGDVGCTACPVGWYCPGGNPPQPCAAGTSSATIGATSAATCIRCVGGMISSAGAASCTVCIGNTGAIAEGTSCVACPAGDESVNGSCYKPCSIFGSTYIAHPTMTLTCLDTSVNQITRRQIRINRGGVWI